MVIKYQQKILSLKIMYLVSALLKFEDGMIGKVSSNLASVTPHHHIVSIYGTKSTFFIIIK